MMGDKIHFMFWVNAGDRGDLRYAEFDFSNGNAKAVLIQDQVDSWFPYTVYMGTQTRSAAGITMHESYTAASLR